MDFTFTEDQLLFQDSVRDFLVNEITPEAIRKSWETDSGRMMSCSMSGERASVRR